MHQSTQYCQDPSPFTRTGLLLLVLAPLVISVAQTNASSIVAQTRLVAELEAEKVPVGTNVSSIHSSASTWFDVSYYGLHLTVLTQTSYLKGEINIDGVCRSATAGPLVLDLMDHMHIDSIALGGVATSFQQNTSSFSINLPRAYNPGETLSLVVSYEGNPLPTGFGSFEFASHPGGPWIWTLSEPYGAKDWWPCKDDPSDKADSADVFVTCDSTLKVGSEGDLVSVVSQGNGTSTSHWHEGYPIASYLLSVAIADYQQFVDWFRYSSSDSMEVLNYVLPEHFAAARTALVHEVDMLSVFSNLYGMYPFIKEKYGHSEFGWGGAMEHQTMTSTTTFNEDVISHELAHQWFGDMITCQTWADLWLNEGFAQYSSALFREKEYGQKSYWDYMNGQMSLAAAAKGEIGIADTSSVRNLFDPSRIYSKGATVLHMLRHVLGDSVFFQCVRSYADQPGLRYSTASIRDFESVCENVSGRSLAWFFREWIYGEGFPQYYFSWSSKQTGSTFNTTVALSQETPTGYPTYFTMPIDIRFSGDKWDTVVTIFNDSLQQQFTFSLSTKPSTVLLDPNGWILNQSFNNNDIPPTQYTLDQNYPNPFNPSTNIGFQLRTRSFVILKVFDILGQEVATLEDGEMPAGTYTAQWNAAKTPTGVYFCRFEAHPVEAVQAEIYHKVMKMLVIK